MLFKQLDKLKSPGYLYIVIVGALSLTGALLQTKEAILKQINDTMSSDKIIYSLIILVLLLGLIITFFIIKEIRSSKRKIIIFIAPMQEGEFYNQHLNHLVAEAKAQANTTLEILITYYCPMKAFDGRDPEVLWDLIDGLPVSGIFMIPADPDKLTNRDGIKKFKKKFPATVLLDVSYTEDSHEINKLPHFIGGDENAGGSLAATLAIDYLKKAGNPTKEIKILILKGRSTKWERQRIESFSYDINNYSLDIGVAGSIKVIETSDLNYKKENAEQYLNNLGDRLFDYNIIFACNDEMAIGALKVLDSWAKIEELNKKLLPKIIGYDGTPAIKKLIDENNQHILGTIDVDIQAQARKAIQTMHDLLLGRESKEKCDLVSPKEIKHKWKNSKNHQ